MADLQSNPSASLTLSEAESTYCREEKADQEDPTCARLVMTGTFIKVTDQEEVAFAKHALFQQHPRMEDWPASHDFYFSKLNITDIWLIDFFGGPSIIPVEDYFNADPSANEY